MALAITSDGYSYDPSKDTVSKGLPTEGVVSPKAHFVCKDDEHDCIVIGAGYAGLVAVRDLTLSGYKVLLLEARDRIGGRTWTADVEGHLYEMGGTWIHWFQGHIYRELTRYGLESEIYSVSFEQDNSLSLMPDDVTVRDGEEEAELIVEKYLYQFVDIDGNGGRTVLQYPVDPTRNAGLAEVDKISCKDRLDTLKKEGASSEMLDFLSNYVENVAGTSDLSEIAFLDILMWYSQSGYTVRNVAAATGTYKLRSGQSHFARLIFEEAYSSGSLSYTFDAKVDFVGDLRTSGGIVVKTADKTFKAKRAICTVPLNVLDQIQFSPPLSKVKYEAISLGHVNKTQKTHLRSPQPEYKASQWIGEKNSRVVSAIGDGASISPSGTSYLVVFGRDDPSRTDPRDNAKSFIKEMNEIEPKLRIEHVFSHNWVTDEMARGAWCNFRLGFATKYLNALRERASNVIFASADWSLGWRGFIDGAVEEGTRAAYTVKSELSKIDE